ncbi:hypothetical protein ACOMHN_016633 [Nucella lapillus]
MSSHDPVTLRQFHIRNNNNNGPHHDDSTTPTSHRIGLQDYAADVSRNTFVAASDTCAPSAFFPENSETTKTSVASSFAAPTPPFTVTAARPFVKVRPYDVYGCVGDLPLPSAFFNNISP